METWKSIDGYEGYYEASSYGRIRSIERVIILKDKKGLPRPCIFKGKMLKPYIQKGLRSNIQGRYQVVLSKNGITKSVEVHRVIALTFIPNPFNYETVNHKDGNPLNNSTGNLEWLSKADNNRHAFKNGLIKTEKPVAIIDKNGVFTQVFKSEADACRQLNVSQGKIGRAIRRNGTCKGKKFIYYNKPVTTIESTSNDGSE